jgi:hypothetical protein
MFRSPRDNPSRVYTLLWTSADSLNKSQQTCGLDRFSYDTQGRAKGGREVPGRAGCMLPCTLPLASVWSKHTC